MYYYVVHVSHAMLAAAAALLYIKYNWISRGLWQSNVVCTFSTSGDTTCHLLYSRTICIKAEHMKRICWLLVNLAK